jgi:DNA invertase Pin-like site-specific DNA recombinase
VFLFYFSYMRVPDKDQTEALQRDALEAAGCDEIYFDHGVPGATTQRDGLNDLLSKLEAVDTLVVWKLDRLGRSTIHLLQLLSDLRDRGVDFHAITQGLDTTTAVGRMVYGQLAVFAEYERNLISERTKAGMAAAKSRGVHVGRPKSAKRKTALPMYVTLCAVPHVGKQICGGSGRNGLSSLVLFKSADLSQ